MKKKLYKIMGVALVVVLLGSLTIGLAVPAAADPGTLKWTKLDLPKVEYINDDPDEFAESEGDFWATPGIDVGPIAVSPDGETLFAAVSYDSYPYNDWYHVLKSTDGGYSWRVTGFFEEWDDTYLFNDFWEDSAVVDIVVSPDYADDTTVVVATKWAVYQSVDGGKRFVCMDDDPEWSGRIRDLDVALDDGGRLAYMVGVAFDDVYVFATATGMKWEAQEIYETGPEIDNVKAVGFWPGTDALGIAAVVSGDDKTYVRFSFGYIGEDEPWLGWNADIKDACITDAWGNPYFSLRACIGFPDDFDAWGIGNNVCFVGTDGIGYYDYDLDEGVDVAGDVYKIVLKESGTSSAIDLDIRGVLTTLLPTETDIMSIDVSGDAEDCSILVGTDTCDIGPAIVTPPDQFLVYYSTDSGENWAPAAKPPTGGDPDGDLLFEDAWTYVLMAPDFGTSGIAYAATWGEYTSAFQRTSDGGESWNQISIIDYGDETDGYYVDDLDAAGYNAADTLRMTTLFNDYSGAIWERTGGKNWERIWSYANPGVTNEITELIINGDETMFAIDYAAGKIFRSSDMGATWPKTITPKDDLSAVAIVSPTTLYTGHGDGSTTGGIWWSTRSGTGWTKPDDSEIPSTAVVANIGVKGDFVLVGSDAGSVFISSDAGETVERVGLTDPGIAGPPTYATYDLGFADNNIIYAITGGEAGVWRCEVDLDDPGSSEWLRIDDLADGAYDETTVVACGPPLALPPSGVLYLVDGALVVTGDVAGGLWRCTNPTDPAPYPYFEKENKGLATNDSLGFLDVDLFPFVQFCANASALFETDGETPLEEPEYWNQVVMFTDTLDTGVPQTDPGKDATGVGLLPAGYVYPTVGLAWESMDGATSYQYQIAYDEGFDSVVEKGYTSSLVSPGYNLLPNKTYYWRARVADEDANGDLVGAPLISPWSEKWKFKTAIGATMARPDLEAPWSGEPDVPLDPTFEWSGIEWAEVYEYELATDPGTTAGGYFTAPLKALIGTDALVSTAWKCDIALEYETRYYWHVKAFGVDTETPWSDVGTFTTMSVPPEPVEPGPPIVVPPAEQITPAWIWAIVIIGAILVIAVIVLIVTTRRVP